MLSRPGPLPSGSGWSFEVKWDGFRALVSTEDGLRVRSRRGWSMAELLPEMATLPPGLLLDGELVAWRDGDPYFPDVCARVLNRDTSIPIAFVAFDVLRMDGKNMMDASFEERRAALVRLPLRPPVSVVAETFTDGAAPFDAVCKVGLEGVVAKRLSSRYRPGERGWVKTKNPSYWRRDAEIEGVRRSHERRRRAAWSKTI
jgi:bifunctional non-homologous end joining protein LigD